MRFSLRLVVLGLTAALPLHAICQKSVASQGERAGLNRAESAQLPDAPDFSDTLIAGDQAPPQQPGGGAASPGQGNNGQTSSSSGSQAPATPPSTHDQAEEQLKQQEHQRVAGVMATFNTTTNRNAAPLSSGQKFELFFKSESDPWPFLLSGIVAGFDQASGSEPQWGQGMEGYAKRFGAAYSDSFTGNFFGNAVLTSLLHEDPRYFQKGTGSKLKRFLWAATSTVWCKRDKGGWGPNYANVGGNLIGAAIARAYYPANERTVGDTISDGLTVSAEGVVGSEIVEFWPDISRKLRKKHAHDV
ncbi:MAG: hypothetical protein WAN28_07860, partial [Terracidiphilus sp.]